MAQNEHEAFQNAVTSTQGKLQAFMDTLSNEEQAVVASIITGARDGEVEGFMVDTVRNAGRTSHKVHAPSGEIGLGATLSVNTSFGQAAVPVDEKLFNGILAEKIKFGF
jgi:hypothetical protein